MPRKKATSLEVKNIRVQDIPKNKFDLNENMKDAKLILAQYQDILAIKINANFENDTWIFKDLETYNKLIFNFQIVKNALNFNHELNTEIFVIAVKCWTAVELSRKSPHIAYSRLSHLLSAIFVTNGFDSAHFTKLLDLIYQSCYYVLNRQNEYEIKKENDNSILEYIRAIVSFLEFYNRDKYLFLIESLNESALRYKYKSNFREIPSFKDVLKLKMYLDDWFESALKQNDNSKLLRYFPLVLWWRLTTIIPMRPLEFCKIKRDCLTIKEGKYFITFPRFKFYRKGEHRNNITYDTLPIPVELYELFRYYISLTASDEQLGYLINYRTYLLYTSGQLHKYKEIRGINVSNLRLMLFKFYVEIISQEYNVNILSIKDAYKCWTSNDKILQKSPKDSINNMINVGDLRHIAIINMMMQGYDKVEIQRLAGHLMEETQFNYYSHMDNWMDVEIQRIERELKTQGVSALSYDDGNRLINLHPRVYEFFDKQYKQAYINAGNNKNYENYIQLNIGSCKEESMPCPAFNWRHSGCYFCKYWTISIEELEKKRSVIEQDLNQIYKELRGKVSFLKYLHKVQFNELGNISFNIKKGLTTTAGEVQLGIKNVAKLRYMLGVNSYE